MHRALASLLLAGLGLAACAAPGPPPEVPWAALDLPARFDYACEVGRTRERFSLDLQRRRWASDESGLRAIERVEARRIVLESGAVGSDRDRREIDPLTGAYVHELHVSDPIVAYRRVGECHRARFTPLGTRLQRKIADLVERGWAPAEARRMVTAEPSSPGAP